MRLSFDRAIACAWLQFGKPSFSIQKETIKVVHTVCRKAGSNCTTRKSQLKLDGFVNAFLKFHCVCFRFLGGYPGRLLAYHVTGTINRIYTDIHQGSAASQLPVKAPLAGVANSKPAKALEEKHLTQFTFFPHADHLKRFWFEMHPVAD